MWLAFIHYTIALRGKGTVQASKVKGHAVDSGDVRQEDLIGNDRADAADLARRRQQGGVISARRALIRARRLWYPVMLQLHNF